MAVSGLPEPCRCHARCIARLALDMMDLAADEVQIDGEPVVSPIFFMPPFLRLGLYASAKVSRSFRSNYTTRAPGGTFVMRTFKIFIVADITDIFRGSNAWRIIFTIAMIRPKYVDGVLNFSSVLLLYFLFLFLARLQQYYRGLENCGYGHWLCCKFITQRNCILIL